MIKIFATLALLPVYASTVAGNSDSFMEACSDNAKAQCGQFEVFEDRQAEVGRKIPLNVRVWPATGPEPSPEALVFYEGGPGASSVKTGNGLINYFGDARLKHDIVLVDQRGTGKSNPLGCAESFPRGALDVIDSILPPEPIRDCLGKLSEKADLRQYTTALSVDDFADVYRALGYEKVHLFGVSYGSRLALEFLRRHPRMVKSMVIAGVVSPDAIPRLDEPRAIDHALQGVFERCRQTPQCADANTDIADAFAGIDAMFTQGPVSVSTKSKDGSTLEFDFPRAAFTYAVRGLLYAGAHSPLAGMIREAESGNTVKPFADYYLQRTGILISGLVATGNHLSVLCSEDIHLADEDDITRLSADTFQGDQLMRSYQQACSIWPKAEVDPITRTAVRSEVPSLLISGEYDPVTPPAWANKVAKTLPNSQHVIVDGAGHVNLNPCLQSIHLQFLKTGSAQGLDMQCLQPTAE